MISTRTVRPDRIFAEIEAKIAGLRAAGRLREALEECGHHVARRVFFRGDADNTEIAELLEETELVGHILAIRGGLLATVLHRATDAVTRVLRRSNGSKCWAGRQRYRMRSTSG